MAAGAVLGLALAVAPAKPADDPQVRAAFARLLGLRARLIAGRRAPAEYGFVASSLRQARRAKSARLAELFRRVADDQLYRSAFSSEGGQTAFAPDLSPPQRAALDQLVAAAADAQDRSDTAWMKTQLRAHGWFTIGRAGKAADSAAWLLVQHADRDRGFQEAVLRRLGALLPAHETQAINYAYLFDRVAVGRHRPQRYGTQIECTGRGTAAPYDLEAPDGVDARRVRVGLGPVAGYVKEAASECVRDARRSGPDPQAATVAWAGGRR